MLFSDVHIKVRGPHIISPFDESKVQPASYDLALDRKLLIPKTHYKPIDLRYDVPSDYMTSFDMDPYGGYSLQPGSVVLGNTIEVLECPNDIAIRVEGKSSLARLFLLPHVAAGWIDPGFKGQVTLEIVNLGPWVINLYPGMPIAQLNMTKMSVPVEKPYGSSDLGSHYQGQMGPTTSVGGRAKKP